MQYPSVLSNAYNCSDSNRCMKKPVPLPDISLVESAFTYDPDTGVLYTKHGNPIGSNDRSTGAMKVRVGRVTTQVARVAWLLFYREDPIGKKIVHLNGDQRDNRIENLQAKRVR